MPAVCYLVSPRGFCSGVARAVNMVEQVLKLCKSVYFVEDIIHNKMFMASLIERGAVRVSSIDEVPCGAVIVISAHGASLNFIARCESKGLTIVDATCPVVKSIQESVRKNIRENKKIIIIGNRSHPEIVGMLGCANDDSGQVFVVSNEIDIDLLPDMKNENVIYFTQTTLNKGDVSRVIHSLKKKIPHIESEKEDNVCYATAERQQALRNISSKEIDLVIVMGSSNSSNTLRLTEVAIEAGAKDVMRIENKDELDMDRLKNASRFAITSGASAPEFLIEDLVRMLREKILDLEVVNLHTGT